MNRPGHESAEMFLGTEVEASPAQGLKTLFVIGVQSRADIETVLRDPFVSAGGPIEHIYFGANHSFPMLSVNDADQWRTWENMIGYFLDQGFWCTLDFDVSCVEGLAESGLPERNNFIPMISVKIPYVQLLGYNATVKIDDRDFAATNPGVWCHSLHSLTTPTQFTHWKQYTKDEVMK